MSLSDAALLKRALPVLLLALFWGWESWRPFIGQDRGRWGHAGRNLALALFNALVLGLSFGAVAATVATWAEDRQVGLLRWLDLPGPARFVLALVLLDGWMYAWHRLNHSLPFLWRFHRLHHSDPHMDVTTATRFHLGELTVAAVLRLALVPLLGLDLWSLVVYDTLVLAATQFHHADISLGRCDRWLRWLLVTPDMHKVHHSDRRAETDSNYAVVLSLWDRLAGTFLMRSNLKEVVFGLPTAPSLGLSGAVLPQKRNTSAAIQGCATQPRAVYGSWASNPSLTEPTEGRLGGHRSSPNR